MSNFIQKFSASTEPAAVYEEKSKSFLDKLKEFFGFKSDNKQNEMLLQAEVDRLKLMVKQLEDNAKVTDVGQLQTNLTKAKTDLAKATADLNEIKVSATAMESNYKNQLSSLKSELENSARQVASAQADLAAQEKMYLAEIESISSGSTSASTVSLERIRQLQNDINRAREEYNTLNTRFNETTTNLQTAQNNLVAQYEATVSQLKADKAVLDTQLKTMSQNFAACESGFASLTSAFNEQQETIIDSVRRLGGYFENGLAPGLSTLATNVTDAVNQVELLSKNFGTLTGTVNTLDFSLQNLSTALRSEMGSLDRKFRNDIENTSSEWNRSIANAVDFKLSTDFSAGKSIVKDSMLSAVYGDGFLRSADVVSAVTAQGVTPMRSAVESALERKFTSDMASSTSTAIQSSVLNVIDNKVASDVSSTNTNTNSAVRTLVIDSLKPAGSTASTIRNAFSDAFVDAVSSSGAGQTALDSIFARKANVYTRTDLENMGLAGTNATAGNVKTAVLSVVASDLGNATGPIRTAFDGRYYTKSDVYNKTEVYQKSELEGINGTGAPNVKNAVLSVVAAGISANATNVQNAVLSIVADNLTTTGTSLQTTFDTRYYTKTQVNALSSGATTLENAFDGRMTNQINAGITFPTGTTAPTTIATALTNRFYQKSELDGINGTGAPNVKNAVLSVVATNISSGATNVQNAVLSIVATTISAGATTIKGATDNWYYTKTDMNALSSGATTLTGAFDGRMTNNIVTGVNAGITYTTAPTTISGAIDGRVAAQIANTNSNTLQTAFDTRYYTKTNTDSTFYKKTELEGMGLTTNATATNVRTAVLSVVAAGIDSTATTVQAAVDNRVVNQLNTTTATTTLQTAFDNRMAKQINPSATTAQTVPNAVLSVVATNISANATTIKGATDNWYYTKAEINALSSNATSLTGAFDGRIVGGINAGITYTTAPTTISAAIDGRVANNIVTGVNAGITYTTTNPAPTTISGAVDSRVDSRVVAQIGSTTTNTLQAAFDNRYYTKTNTDSTFYKKTELENMGLTTNATAGNVKNAVLSVVAAGISLNATNVQTAFDSRIVGGVNAGITYTTAPTTISAAIDSRVAAQINATGVIQTAFDNRYYTKTNADSTFYKKTESDLRYAPMGTIGTTTPISGVANVALRPSSGVVQVYNGTTTNPSLEVTVNSTDAEDDDFTNMLFDTSKWVTTTLPYNASFFTWEEDSPVSMVYDYNSNRMIAALTRSIRSSTDNGLTWTTIIDKNTIPSLLTGTNGPFSRDVSMYVINSITIKENRNSSGTYTTPTIVCTGHAYGFSKVWNAGQSQFATNRGSRWEGFVLANVNPASVTAGPQNPLTSAGWYCVQPQTTLQTSYTYATGVTNIKTTLPNPFLNKIIRFVDGGQVYYVDSVGTFVPIDATSVTNMLDRAKNYNPKINGTIIGDGSGILTGVTGGIGDASSTRVRKLSGTTYVYGDSIVVNDVVDARITDGGSWFTGVKVIGKTTNSSGQAVFNLLFDILPEVVLLMQGGMNGSNGAPIFADQAYEPHLKYLSTPLSVPAWNSTTPWTRPTGLVIGNPSSKQDFTVKVPGIWYPVNYSAANDNTVAGTIFTFIPRPMVYNKVKYFTDMNMFIAVGAPCGDMETLTNFFDNGPFRAMGPTTATNQYIVGQIMSSTDGVNWTLHRTDSIVMSGANYLYNDGTQTMPFANGNYDATYLVPYLVSVGYCPASKRVVSHDASLAWSLNSTWDDSAKTLSQFQSNFSISKDVMPVALFDASDYERVRSNTWFIRMLRQVVLDGNYEWVQDLKMFVFSGSGSTVVETTSETKKYRSIVLTSSDGVKWYGANVSNVTESFYTNVSYIQDLNLFMIPCQGDQNVVEIDERLHQYKGGIDQGRDVSNQVRPFTKSIKSYTSAPLPGQTGRWVNTGTASNPIYKFVKDGAEPLRVLMSSNGIDWEEKVISTSENMYIHPTSTIMGYHPINKKIVFLFSQSRMSNRRVNLIYHSGTLIANQIMGTSQPTGTVVSPTAVSAMTDLNGNTFTTFSGENFLVRLGDFATINQVLLDRNNTNIVLNNVNNNHYVATDTVSGVSKTNDTVVVRFFKDDFGTTAVTMGEVPSAIRPTGTTDMNLPYTAEITFGSSVRATTLSTLIDNGVPGVKSIRIGRKNVGTTASATAWYNQSYTYIRIEGSLNDPTKLVYNSTAAPSNTESYYTRLEYEIASIVAKDAMVVSTTNHVAAPVRIGTSQSGKALALYAGGDKTRPQLRINPGDGGVEIQNQLTIGNTVITEGQLVRILRLIEETNARPTTKVAKTFTVATKNDFISASATSTSFLASDIPGLLANNNYTYSYTEDNVTNTQRLRFAWKRDNFVPLSNMVRLSYGSTVIGDFYLSDGTGSLLDNILQVGSTSTKMTALFGSFTTNAGFWRRVIGF